MNLIVLTLMSLIMQVTEATITVKSQAFESNGNIPSQYTCDGENISPQLDLSDFPKETKSFALIMDDPDAPSGTFVHWVMWNIAPRKMIEEDNAPGVQGKNSKQENKYTGPCPPSGTHHYHFKVYAINTILDLAVGSTKQELLDAIQGHIIAQGELVGLYKKK